jgi:hypothetical protein
MEFLRNALFVEDPRKSLRDPSSTPTVVSVLPHPLCFSPYNGRRLISGEVWKGTPATVEDAMGRFMKGWRMAAAEEPL